MPALTWVTSTGLDKVLLLASLMHLLPSAVAFEPAQPILAGCREQWPPLPSFRAQRRSW